jgi:hypothetical protein
MRRALVKIDAAAIMNVVDSFNLSNVRLSAVIVVPLRQLQVKRDVAAFAAGAPLDAVAGLLEVLAVEPLDAVIEALGENADHPSYEQLRDAVAALRSDGLGVNETVALLAYAVGQEFPAAPHCLRLLDEDPELSLPEVTVTAGTASLLRPKEVPEDVREMRRARKEALKAKKKRAPVTAKPYKKKPGPAARVEVLAPPASVEIPDVPRRSPRLTPVESARFSTLDPLSGWVVTTEVPFSAVDPSVAEMNSKVRPVVVLAGSEKELLVRAIYSHEAPTRRIFAPWRRVGLDHVSYIDDTHVVVERSAVTKLISLSDEEWNALLV